MIGEFLADKSGGAAASHPGGHPTAFGRWLIWGSVLGATAMIWLLPAASAGHPLAGLGLLVKAIAYVAFAAVVGALGMRLAWKRLAGRNPGTAAFSAASAGAGSVFVPSIALFYTRQSPWMLLAAALATSTLMFRLFAILPAELGQPRRQARLESSATPLPSLDGLPGPDSHPLRSFWIALCVQAGILFSFREELFYASALLSAAVCLLIWQWKALDRSSRRKRETPNAILYAAAILLTFFALLPTQPVALSSFGATPHKPPPTGGPAEAADPSSGYVGIVLLPPPVKRAQMLPPAPLQLSLGAAAGKPVVIPFDGPYWYFKAPHNRPGRTAHVAHGKPSEVNIKSSDFAPLLMEAYQNIGMPIDLACCREIDVAITNADTRPGGIALSLALNDNNSPGKPFENLGEKPVPSSDVPQIPLNRPPVKEVLRFAVPKIGAIHRFDAITVVFVPARERARAGAKVSIESFELIPR